jgi:hypothetical protein
MERYIFDRNTPKNVPQLILTPTGVKTREGYCNITPSRIAYMAQQYSQPYGNPIPYEAPVKSCGGLYPYWPATGHDLYGYGFYIPPGKAGSWVGVL